MSNASTVCGQRFGAEPQGQAPTIDPSRGQLLDPGPEQSAQRPRPMCSTLDLAAPRGQHLR
eukprot:2514766-Alexandrium_andersonii.AAC.1